MAAIKESGGGYAKPKASKPKRRPAGASRGSASKSSKRGTASKSRRPAAPTSQNASSAAGGMSKKAKAGYAAVTQRNSNFVAQNRRNIRNTRKQARAAAGSGGSNPIDSLGKGIRDFFGAVVPQDILMNQNTNAIRRATRRK